MAYPRPRRSCRTAPSARRASRGPCNPSSAKAYGLYHTVDFMLVRHGMPLIAPSTVLEVLPAVDEVSLGVLGDVLGQCDEVGRQRAQRPGCGKSIMSGGLPPWISTGAWTSNWSVPWKSILAPVHSANGFQKSVKSWTASGSLLAVADRREHADAVLPAYCCSHLISPLTRLSPAAPPAVPAEHPAGALVSAATPRSSGRRGISGPAVVGTTGHQDQGRDGPECCDAFAVSHLETPPSEAPAERVGTRWLQLVPPRRLAAACVTFGNGVESHGRFRALP